MRPTQLFLFTIFLLLASSAAAQPAEPAARQAPTTAAPSLADLKAAGAARSSYRNAEQPSPAGPPQANLAAYRKEIGPLLRRACAECHGESQQEANFRVDTLDPDLIRGEDSAWWLEVVSVLSNAEMPPADADVQLSDDERSKIVDWLSAELQTASAVARSEQGGSSFRRLTRYEYNYALQDLLGLPYDFARDLPPEAASEAGFQNSSEMLHMSAVQLAMYRDLGRRALRKATVRGERPQPVHYAVTMDKAADLMRGKRNQRGGNPLSKKFNRGAPHFVNQETGEGVNGRYRYSGARYSWSPVAARPDVPAVSPFVFILPAGARQIFDLGDHLPDEGTLRLRLRAARASTEGEGYPDLRVSFGFQASNNSEAAFRVGDDLAIQAAPALPRFYQLDIPLGELSRNPYRGVTKLGQTPNPSEYLVFQNVGQDRKFGAVQIDYIEITAPHYEQWPPASHRRVFMERMPDEDDASWARRVLSRFMKRAWRRPIADEEIERKLALLEELLPASANLEEALVEVLATVLASPHFLYLSPTGGDDASAGDFALAMRLAAFLWSSVPDERLLQAAAAGELRQPAALARQVERMLDDPRSDRFAKHFVRQWLGMELLDYLKIDQETHGRLDPLLREAMQQEPVAFFQQALAKNRSIVDFLHADYAVVNERLANHYGIAGVHGSHFREAPLQPEHHRGGVLTQAGLLAMNSDGKDSHPLKRGIWLLENLLHDPPPPPPPAVPEIDLADPDILKLTLKQRMEDHRSDPACMSCHARIDPWGIAFENFDALGRWRDEVGRAPVDATSTLFNGEKLDGIDGLKRYLLRNRQDQFVRAVTHKAAAYALGRPLTFADRADVERIAAELRQSGDGLRTLVKLIAASSLFSAPNQ